MDRSNPSRRELLLSIGTIGVASIGAGVGTYAAFRDREQAASIVTAGGLDLRVHHESNYNGRPSDSVTGGTVDGDPGMVFDLPDVKPGDSGRSRFCFELRTNPAYLWLCGELTANAEAGQTEPERKAETDPGSDTGELADAIDVTLNYADAAGNSSETITEGSLRTVLAQLSNGLPLDGAGREDVDAGEQQAFEPGSGDDPLTEPCIVFEWTIPESVGNEIQTDRVEFGLTFYAQQARHTDGTENPCDEQDGSDGEPNPKAISFAAFCVDSGTVVTDDVTLSIAETNDDGEPIAVDWTADQQVDRVVLKTGGGRLAIENFAGGRSGTATVGEGSPRIEGQIPSSPCPNGESSIKFEYDSEQEAFVPE